MPGTVPTNLISTLCSIQKDICLNALSLLEKIIINTSSESEIMLIIKKRLLSKMVLNLGSI